MSTHIKATIVTYTTAADYSTTGQYLFCYLSSNTAVTKTATKGGNSIGVIMNAPESGDRTEVAVMGGALVLAAETIARGEQITSNSSGQAINPDAAGQRLNGVAMESADSGDIFPILLTIGESHAAEA